jgi:hypothetical protein
MYHRMELCRNVLKCFGGCWKFQLTLKYCTSNTVEQTMTELTIQQGPVTAIVRQAYH